MVSVLHLHGPGPTSSNRVLILAGVFLVTFPCRPDAEPYPVLFTRNLMYCGVEADIKVKVGVVCFLLTVAPLLGV